MFDGPSINKHHLVPQSRVSKSPGNKYQGEWIHVCCHNHIHATFTEKELERTFNTWSALRKTQGIKKFVQWIATKDPCYRGCHKNVFAG